MEKAIKTGRLLAIVQTRTTEREARKEVGWGVYARYIRYYARSAYLQLSHAADRDVVPRADSPEAERRRKLRESRQIARRGNARGKQKAVHFRMNEGIRISRKLRAERAETGTISAETRADFTAYAARLGKRMAEDERKRDESLADCGRCMAERRGEERRQERIARNVLAARVRQLLIR